MNRRQSHAPLSLSSAALLLFLALLAVWSGQTGCDKLVTEKTENSVFDSTTGAACLRCHTDQNDSLIVIPKAQWEHSAHASDRLIEATVALNGGTFATATCGPQCHSGNGYVRSIIGGAASTQASVIGCFACHQPHTGSYGKWRLDTLRGDTASLSLLTSSPAPAIYSMGKSNMCARCHQATAVPTIAATDSTVLVDNLFGPHASPQANILAGVGGFLFTPAAVINSHNSVANATQGGCLACHFVKGVGYDLGEHSFAMRAGGAINPSSCNVTACHATAPITSFDSRPGIDSVTTLLDSLRRRLAGMNIIDTTGQTGLELKAHDTLLPRDLAKILHNYLLVSQDRSNGIHNMRYTTRLLIESIGRLDSVPTARFGASPRALCFGVPVQFADSSTGSVQRWFWKFGDNQTSSVASPAHVYTHPGNYDVTLTVTGPAGSSSTKRLAFVVVDTTRAKIGLPASAQAGIPAQFADSSTGANIVAWSWDFGDLTTTNDTSSARNPQYTYPSAGVYTVTLNVTGDCGVGATTRQLTVAIPPPSPKRAEIISRQSGR